MKSFIEFLTEVTKNSIENHKMNQDISHRLSGSTVHEVVKNGKDHEIKPKRAIKDNYEDELHYSGWRRKSREWVLDVDGDHSKSIWHHRKSGRKLTLKMAERPDGTVDKRRSKIIVHHK